MRNYCSAGNATVLCGDPDGGKREKEEIRVHVELTHCAI